QPLAGASLSLYRTAPGSEVLVSRDGVGWSGADGTFTSERVKPGQHRLYVLVDQVTSRSRVYFSEDTLLIAPGESKTWEVRLHTRRVEVRVLSTDGRPLPGRHVQLTPALLAGYFGALSLDTDPSGCAVLEPAPATDLAITIRSPDCSDAEFARLDAVAQGKRT